MDINWDPNTKNVTVWFCELAIGTEYELYMPRWYDQLNEQWKAQQKETSVRELSLKGVNLTQWTLAGGRTIKPSSDINLGLWTTFFSLWAKAQKPETLDRNKPVLIHIKRESVKRWFVTKITNCEPIVQPSLSELMRLEEERMNNG